MGWVVIILGLLLSLLSALSAFESHKQVSDGDIVCLRSLEDYYEKTCYQLERDRDANPWATGETQ